MNQYLAQGGGTIGITPISKQERQQLEQINPAKHTVQRVWPPTHSLRYGNRLCGYIHQPKETGSVRVIDVALQRVVRVGPAKLGQDLMILARNWSRHQA